MALNRQDFPGVYRARVVNNLDPKKQRRLQVEISTSIGQFTDWVWPMEAASMTTEVPSIGQGVWVQFQAGDHEYPVWFGAFGKHQGKSKKVFVKPLLDSVSTTSIQDVIIINNQNDGTKELDLTDTIIAIANKEKSLQNTLQQVQIDLQSIIAGQGIQGAQGRQGVQGTQGIQGTQGATGAGTQGTTGSQGTQGIIGGQGATGAGTQGIQGIQGPQGLQGSTGSQGTTGAGTQGATGAQGATGSDGAQGSTGTTGVQGTTGTQGSTGTQGTEGTQGSTGAQGTTGSTGTQGATGTQGSTGTQGTTGSQGVQGTIGTGTQGETGTQGATGTQGSTGSGAQGVQGPQGTTGTTGAGGTVAYYGNFYDDADQSATVDTPTAVKFNHDFGSNGVSVQSDGTNLTRVTFAHTGTYNIQFSAEYHNTGGGGNGQTVQVWFRKNGTDVPQSNTYVTVNTNSPYIVASWNFVDSVTAGDYYQLMWQTDNANILLDAFSSGSTPAVPSVILTATQVAYSIQGIQGLQGGTGTQGSTGATGATGSQGTTGATGATGTQGSTGSQGTTGTQGSTGSQGTTGAQGTTGTSASDLNAWTSYTPTIRTQTGTVTVGNGSITGAYKTIGKTCFFRLKFSIGSTTAIGANPLVYGLPATAKSTSYVFDAVMLDNGNAWYAGFGNGDYLGSTTEFVIIYKEGTGTTWGGQTNTSPFSLLSGDYVVVTGSYEIA